MYIYVCMFCREELYKNEEEPKFCSSHPVDTPIDKIYIETIKEEKDAI